MAGIDATQRKLVFPPRFVPYLEKHRIFELFHELTELLIHERPKDHVTFLKEVLPCAATRRDKPRIVFIAPPSFDRAKFAKEIANILQIGCYARYYLEMKERERLLLEWMKKQAMKKLSEEEESSCVCPSEIFPGEYEIPEENTKQSIVEPYNESSTVSEKEEEVMAREEYSKSSTTESMEDPCKGLRVCPCKEQKAISSTEMSEEESLDFASSDSKESTAGETLSENRTETFYMVNEESSVTEIGEPPKSVEKAKKIGASRISCICESEKSVVDFGFLGGCEYSTKGWILIDFPEDADEALRLSEQGAIPTHAIRIVTGGSEEKCRRYKYMSKEWEAVYKSVPVMELHVNGRDTIQFARDVSKLLKIMPHRHAPMLPRIVLIGSRGSGTTTQANLLARKYKLAHVNFQYEMARVLLQDTKLSEAYKRQLRTRPDPELEAAILEKIFLTPRCSKRGWVLTGYPTNIDQLRMLDLVATPPNRIIFIEVPAKECFIRCFYRKTDPTDGKEYKLPALESFAVEGVDLVGMDPAIRDRLMSHPRDDRRQIIHDIEQYYEEKEEMMKYCGKTAAYVNGNKSVDSVFELIDDIIIKPSPAEPPRNPLAVGHGIEEAYERLQKMRMNTGITHNNLLVNPPDPIFKF